MTALTINLWAYFLLCFTLFMLTSLWMTQVARHFKTHAFNGNIVSFSIFDLEFALSEEQLAKLIGRADSHTKQQLRLHLIIDFVFMAATYTGIAILCLITSQKMEHFGRYLFAALAVVQILPWLFDVIENIYLLQKVKGPDTRFPNFFKTYQTMVKAKFIIALTGAVCSLFGLLFFWLVGNFHMDSLRYVGAVVAEIILFIIISSLLQKNPKKTMA